MFSMFSRRGFIATGLASAFALPVFAKQPPVYTEGTIAIDGTDAVAYFTMSKPVAGSDEHTLDWNGSTWRFSSAENKAAFMENPEKYAPQYGGYCAFAMSKGYVAPTVPEAWTIVDGKLYLNFSTQVRGLWEKDIPGNIVKGDANWPKALEN